MKIKAHLLTIGVVGAFIGVQFLSTQHLVGLILAVSLVGFYFLVHITIEGWLNEN